MQHVLLSRDSRALQQAIASGKTEHLTFRDTTFQQTGKKQPPTVVFHQSDHPLPYFAHQQLDIDYFPHAIGQPVGGPKVDSDEDEADQDGWDDDDNDVGADVESDAGDGLGITNAKPKIRRRFNSDKIAKAEDIKKLKLHGGRPAVAKKVSADLDSDDELIVRMKEARYLEKDIAQALIDQGRTNYNPKTIGTRWRRLKTALQKRQDALLDAELTDWHEGDDDALLQAVVKADKEVKRKIDEIEAQKWRIVADKIKTLKPVLNFSQHACRKRYDSLMNGTAKPTPESIPCPTPEDLERIQSRKDKEARISQNSQVAEMEKQNMEGNGWTSRMRTYY